MARSIRSFLVPLLLIVIPTMLVFLWGLSWALGDFPECSQGSYFLADAGWVVEGMLLGLVVGIVVPIVLAVRRSFLLAVPVIAAAGLGMLVAGDAGAAIAARSVGCDVFGDVADAGQATLLGLAIGAVPTILIVGIVVGIVVGIGWIIRARRSS